MNMTTTRGSPCNHNRRTAPSSVVRWQLTKRNKQINPPKTKTCIICFVADRKTWDNQRIVPGVSVKLMSRFPGCRAKEKNQFFKDESRSFFRNFLCHQGFHHLLVQQIATIFLKFCIKLFCITLNRKRMPHMQRPIIKSILTDRIRAAWHRTQSAAKASETFSQKHASQHKENQTTHPTIRSLGKTSPS